MGIRTFQGIPPAKGIPQIPSVNKKKGIRGLNFQCGTKMQANNKKTLNNHHTAEKRMFFYVIIAAVAANISYIHKIAEMMGNA